MQVISVINVLVCFKRELKVFRDAKFCQTWFASELKIVAEALTNDYYEERIEMR